MILGIFDMFSIFFMELTLHRQKTLFLYFNVSGTQTTSKWPGNLRASVFGRNEAWERRKRTNGDPRAKIGWPTRPDSLAAWDPLSWASSLRCRRSSSPCLRLDLKTTIKIVPRQLSEEGAAETQNHETEDLELQIGGGKLRRDAAGVVSIFSNISTIITMMKGV